MSQHRKVYNILPKPPPDLLRKSKRLGLRKSPITGDNKSSPKAIFLDVRYIDQEICPYCGRNLIHYRIIAGKSQRCIYCKSLIDENAAKIEAKLRKRIFGIFDSEERGEHCGAAINRFYYNTSREKVFEQEESLHKI